MVSRWCSRLLKNYTCFHLKEKVETPTPGGLIGSNISKRERRERKREREMCRCKRKESLTPLGSKGRISLSFPPLSREKHGAIGTKRGGFNYFFLEVKSSIASLCPCSNRLSNQKS